MHRQLFYRWQKCLLFVLKLQIFDLFLSKSFRKFFSRLMLPPQRYSIQSARAVWLLCMKIQKQRKLGSMLQMISLFDVYQLSHKKRAIFSRLNFWVFRVKIANFSPLRRKYSKIITSIPGQLFWHRQNVSTNT
jgi:hypothetical protein